MKVEFHNIDIKIYLRLLTSNNLGRIMPITDINICLIRNGKDIIQRRVDMANKRVPLFVGVDTVISDLGVSRAKAYEVIRQLNKEMKEQNPRAIVVAGKVNRIWYEEACRLITAPMNVRGWIRKRPSMKGSLPGVWNRMEKKRTAV
jgi:hypothetical protein